MGQLSMGISVYKNSLLRKSKVFFFLISHFSYTIDSQPYAEALEFPIFQDALRSHNSLGKTKHLYLRLLDIFIGNPIVKCQVVSRDGNTDEECADTFVGRVMEMLDLGRNPAREWEGVGRPLGKVCVLAEMLRALGQHNSPIRVVCDMVDAGGTAGPVLEY